MKLFISVISHRHHDVIINLESLKSLATHKDIEIVCLDNIPTRKLKKYCQKYGIHYLENSLEHGFAYNNNQVFLFCQQQLSMTCDDSYMLLNPDVLIDINCVNELIANVKKHPKNIHAPNLYLDREHLVHDDNIRKYPTFCNFVRTYLFNDRSTMINRSKKDLPPQNKIWASGALMVMKVNIYQKLGGLDETYYLYCEDIDICMRAKRLKYYVSYIPSAKAVHFRQRDSKRFLTCYFFWHVQSVFYYTFAKAGWRKVSSSITTKNQLSTVEAKQQSTHNSTHK